MSPSSSGSKFRELSFPFEISDATRVGEARRFSTALAEDCRLSEEDSGRLAILINELGTNLAKYARGGSLVLRRLSAVEGFGVEVLAVDSGDGFDVSLALRDGFSTSSTPGTGLGAVSRLANEWDIYSQKGKGSVVLARVRASGVLDWNVTVGALCVPLKSECASGDAWSVGLNNNRLETVVIDGLGHGPEAENAALEGIIAFQNSAGLTIDQKMLQIHGRMKSTRGGAVYLVSQSQTGIDHLGVGNIRALALSGPDKSKALISHNGTAGVQIRTMKPLTLPFVHDGTLLLHTDGITSRWDLAEYPGLKQKHPSVQAAVLWRDFARGTDDATVLVIRRNNEGFDSDLTRRH